MYYDRRQVRKQFQNFPVTQTFSGKLRQSNPDNVHHKNEKQHTEYEKKRAEKSFDDVTVEFFYHGSNLPKKPQKNNFLCDFFYRDLLRSKVR